MCILPDDERFAFLQNIRNILPQVSNQTLVVVLPFTENKRMLEIITYLEDTAYIASVSGWVLAKGVCPGYQSLSSFNNTFYQVSQTRPSAY